MKAGRPRAELAHFCFGEGTGKRGRSSSRRIAGVLGSACLLACLCISARADFIYTPPAPAHPKPPPKTHPVAPPSTAPTAPPPPPLRLRGDNSKQPQALWNGPTTQFVTCAVLDSTGWWWGTEGDGVWHYAPNAPAGRNWAHYRGVDGVGDDEITALCIDGRGLLWAGTARHGVSVFDGNTWKNYDQLTGPLGAHVTGIAACPTSGDVWMTTDLGLAIYQASSQTWRYITRADGLVSNALTCVAFTSTGKAIVGTATYGLEMASPSDNYAKWTRSTTPDDALTRTPTTSESTLSFDLVNCLLVTKGSPERIYAGTTSGLMWSDDGGATWTFERSKDYADKLKGRIEKSAPMPGSGISQKLAEDYVTTLSEDPAAHRLYVGHWRLGYEVVDESTLRQVQRSEYQVLGDFVKSILPVGSDQLLVGRYGNGLALLVPPAETAPDVASFAATAAASTASLPAPAQAPTADALSAIDGALAKDAHNAQAPFAYYLGEDWQTQGDWVGRYGRRYAVLYSVQDPKNEYIASQPYTYKTLEGVGYKADQKTGLGTWIQWPQTTDRRVLYNPIHGYRREAEIDDHGEQFSSTIQGPDLWVVVDVPAGMHRLSMYFMNKDGHVGLNMRRDFIIQVKQSSSDVIGEQYLDANAVTPTLATARVHDFWSGVYESFALKGPAEYFVKIDRNFSLDVILQAVMLDSLDSAIPPSHKLAWLADVNYSAPDAGASDLPAAATWSKLDGLYDSYAALAGMAETRIMLLRSAVAAGAPDALIDNWRWQLRIWKPEDRETFDDTMKRALTQVYNQLNKPVPPFDPPYDPELDPGDQ